MTTTKAKPKKVTHEIYPKLREAVRELDKIEERMHNLYPHIWIHTFNWVNAYLVENPGKGVVDAEERLSKSLGRKVGAIQNWLNHGRFLATKKLPPTVNSEAVRTAVSYRAGASEACMARMVSIIRSGGLRKDVLEEARKSGAVDHVEVSRHYKSTAAALSKAKDRRSRETRIRMELIQLINAARKVSPEATFIKIFDKDGKEMYSVEA